MTAATAEKTRTTDPGGGRLAEALTGTGTLLRFNLRRDRVRLPVWLLALLLATLGSLSSFADLYGDAEQRQASAATMDTPAGLALSGPREYLTDYNLGSMLSHQMIGFTAVMVALMSVFIVARHTRTEEETGRAELVRSAVVGRHAYLTAALGVAAVANVALALLLAVALGGSGVEGVTWGGSLLYGAAHAAVGLVFAAVAAVTVQITAYSRGASGMALAVLGGAYLLRAAGDVGGGALSWLSPIGWAQRTYPYVHDRWWPLLPSLALLLAVAAAAYALSVRRDVGAGLRPAAPGRPAASRHLTRPLGFALRLHRGLLIGFGVAALLLGASYGSLLSEVESLIEQIGALEEAVEGIGGASLVDSFSAMILTVTATVAAVYAVLAAQRARSEETAGRAEPLLATALSRGRWLGGHLTVALLGGALMLLLSGLGFGVAGAASTGDWALVPRLAGASLAYAPALWVTVGLAAVLFGWAPRWLPLVWAVPVYAFVVGYLGQIFQFPHWTGNVSPFGHVPRLPAEDMDWLPLLALTALAAGLLALGLAGFRHRDLDSK
ncbi:ABC transporter permease [Streptomyces alkaliterrae]|uniref:ABC transporter permease n=1 Tax=Streptomyces alkaliterrae TaxID=2213162 RepID=A0A5P0YR71_9ACTN|nr:ABC transporter permease [Streptomyces alkaliterrae]MBB1259886.1 ABC transporter permease [Streptomyces alkaliterrae]MQS02814.1 ABC transporter permease [Streptomyces alkaliterrae]